MDSYFLSRLQLLMTKMKTPAIQHRKDYVENIFDSIMDLADEYQAVMVENEDEEYWESIELWDDELRQRNAIRWVNDSMQEQEDKS